jgi:glycosyltransferase involved in cell wall biosynthesis
MTKTKKRLLFIINNLNCGGAEKALISLLQTIDYEKNSVDLFLFKQEGLFLNQIPANVNLLDVPKNYHYFDMPLKRALLSNLKIGNFKVAFYRIMFGLIYKIEKTHAVKEQRGWKYLKNVLAPLTKKYDVAIGFLEKTPNYFCIDKVSARKKIGFVMNDYDKLKMDKTIDNYYFSKLDFIVQDSEESNIIMKKNFPQFAHKTVVIKSIISAISVQQLAQQTITDLPEGFKIISVGRLTYQKGYDIAMAAINIIAKKGLNFKWIILGDGDEEKILKQKVIDYNLQDKVFFFGIKENHYPYLKQADIFLHTARFEGFGIVISEAKILQKPIVLTNFNVAKTHINDGVNGFIAEMNAESVAYKLELLMTNNNLQKQFSQNLSKDNFGTENEIEKFYAIIK